MEWLNENAGIIVFVAAIVIIALSAVALYLLFYLKNRIAVQRLSFLGFYSASVDTGKRYADLTVGNPSLHTVGVSEIGVKNGKVSFNLTEIYREKAGLPSDAKLVVGQRGSVTLRLTAEELKKLCIKTGDGKLKVGTLRAYVVDFAGCLYQGKVGAVKKLLKELLAEAGTPKPAETAAEKEEA